MADEPQSVGDILDKVQELADANDRVVVGEVLEALGSRGFGPLLVLIPLVEVSPVGGIPGLPTALAIVVILVAGQLALGRRHLWLPGFITRRSILSTTAKVAAADMRPTAQRLDRWFHGRLPALTGGPFLRIAAAACIALAATVPPLELLPFASSAPMLAIAAVGLAITVRDGVLMIAACAAALAAAGIGVGLIGS